jgi:predicted ribosome quality control (RQC) complex YloA/Tae2 family protein
VSRLGAPHELWLHAQGVPGAHVLVRNPARAEPPESIVEAAARIAARFSAAFGEAHVDVTVAPLNRVKKRKGALPGQVEVTGGRTVRVRPGLPHVEGAASGGKA